VGETRRILVDSRWRGGRKPSPYLIAIANSARFDGSLSDTAVSTMRPGLAPDVRDP
jgi:hypothetical protein